MRFGEGNFQIQKRCVELDTKKEDDLKYKKLCIAGLLLAFGMALCGLAKAQDTIKVGVLHSLSGTMAISETTLKDTILMMIDAQNKKGGLLGKKLEAVVVDPASNWPLFAEKAAGVAGKR